MSAVENEAINPNDPDQPVDESLLMGDGEEQAQDESVESQEPEAKAEEPEVRQDPEEMPVVPRARFNEVNEERKALKAQLEQYQAEQRGEVYAPVDMKALRRQATQALLEGDTDKHDEIQFTIDAENIRMAEERAEARIMRAQEQAAFQNVAVALATEFPVLDAESGNAEAIEMVVELRDSYIAKGMNMVQALDKAARRVAPLFGGSKPQAAQPVAADARTLKAVKRGAEASNSVPMQQGGVGNRAQSPAESGSVTQSQWEKMSAEDRERMLSAA